MLSEGRLLHERFHDGAFVREMLRAACAKEGSQKAWARKHGVSPAYVGDVLSGRREPGEAICEPLKLERLVLYRYYFGPQRARRTSTTTRT